MARRTRYGRSLLVTALIGAVIGSATSLHPTVRADLGLPDTRSVSGGKGSSSSVCMSDICVIERALPRSNEKGSTETDVGRTGGNSSFVRDTNEDKDKDKNEDEDEEAEKEARKKAEEARHKAEDDRKRAEEEWKRVESERIRIEEEARERLRKEEEERQQKIDEARKNALPPAGGEDVQPGCFSISGEWTTDRALCMQPTPLSQEVVTEHPDEKRIQEAKENALHKKMEKRYVATPEVEGKRMALLDLIQESAKRLSAVQSTGLVTNPEQQQFIGSSIEWLKGGAAYFSESRREDEVDQMIGYIRQIVVYAQDVVVEARKAGGTSMMPDISALFLRTERLLLVFPDILALLTKEGITVDPSLASDYATLLSYFKTVRDACAQNAASCSALDDVLTGMQHLQASVQSVITVAGKPDVEKLIREVVEARTK